MASESLSFVVKWAANEYKIDIIATATVLCLKKEIENQTGVKVNRQKLLNLKFKGIVCLSIVSRSVSGVQQLSSIPRFLIFDYRESS